MQLINPYFLLLLPCAAASGWLSCVKHYKKLDKQARRDQWSREYFAGLNYLLNEEPDKAVDVFIKMIEVDNETVETHLALGNLFRRRGEVDRAIRIHQNLIARPQLSKQQRLESLFELGQDYMRAGVFDRAERLFIEVVESDDKHQFALESLLAIYEQEKDWRNAIYIAEKMEMSSGKNKQIAIAQYYCELAELAGQQNRYDIAADHLKCATGINRNCARASFIQAQCMIQTQRYPDAIKWYKRAFKQDPGFMPVVMESLKYCYQEINTLDDLVRYSKNALKEQADINLFLFLTHLIKSLQGSMQAMQFLIENVQRYPSLRVLSVLIDLQLAQMTEAPFKSHLILLQTVVENLIENKPVFRCQHCGFSAKTMYWQCPGCREWEMVRPIQNELSVVPV
jgi:lipopolysaccharide assembly protein B